MQIALVTGGFFSPIGVSFNKLRTGICDFSIFPLDFGDSEGETNVFIEFYFLGGCFERTGHAG
ncbi:MAG: hypothetical protein IID17_09155 [Nitrospinae bacterium]|nr:hypothetical protein [Nitrospinota bacterium]